MEEIYLSFQDLENAASELLGLLSEYLGDDQGMHVETAIAAAASLAGVSLLRSFVPPDALANLPAGSLLLDDQVNDRGAELIQAMANFCQPLGIPCETGWNEAVPAVHQSKKSVAELVRDLEAPFRQVVSQLNLHPAFWPHAAAYAALKLVKLGEAILPLDVGKSLTLSTMIAASKSVPESGA